MEEDFKNPEEAEKAMEMLEQAANKFREFVLKEVLPHFKATPEKIFEVRTLLSTSSLLWLPPMRDFLTNYGPHLEARDVDFFRALFPVEFRNCDIPVSIQDKGFLFARVFQSILNDIDQ